VGTGPSLARGIAHALLVRPAWGIGGATGFFIAALLGAQGAVTGFLWGHTVTALESGGSVVWLLVALVIALIAAPLLIAEAVWRYPRWWVEVMLRTRMAVLVGQTAQRRLPASPPGEVVARSMDADRYARYADRWVDFINGLLIAVATALLGGTLLAGGVLLAGMVASALASSIGRPVAGRSAAAASHTRPGIGPHDQARRSHPGGARVPAPGGLGPGGRRRARAPGASSARRRSGGDGASGCGDLLGCCALGLVASGHGLAGRQCGGRFRLV